jgi:formate hydrogenlyase subunit 4
MLTQWIIVAAVLVLAPILGGLLSGIDRKLTARMQGRIGPPIVQPFYDVAKLLRKQAIVLNRVQILYVYLHLAFMVLTVMLLVLRQDILMVLFVHAFSTITLVLGGMSVRSPYSRIGAQRKIMQMVAYEPILVLMVVGIYLQHHSFRVSDIAASITTSGRPLLVSLPLVFVAYFLTVLIKLEKSPFDVSTSHHAHQELVKGITLEYAGPYLALIEITHFYEASVLLAVAALFWSTNLAVGAALATACFLGVILVDNITARLTTRWMVRAMWSVGLALALVNIVWLYL